MYFRSETAKRLHLFSYLQLLRLKGFENSSEAAVGAERRSEAESSSIFRGKVGLVKIVNFETSIIGRP